MNKYVKNLLITGIISTSIISIGCSVNAASIKDLNSRGANTMDAEKQNIPMLSSYKQIGPNKLEISYDKDVDVKLGTKVTNYWIQSTKKAEPEGIASLGKNDKVNNNNSLEADDVKIEAKDGSKNTFILTFEENITKGEEYKLIICYVTVPGAPAYTGDNGSGIFVGK